MSHKDKVVVCRCEDVTLKDIETAVAHGYGDLEEIKRYTGFGTGPCQGKECTALIATVLATLTGVDPALIPPFTSRPPLTPTPLQLFAALSLDNGDSDSPRDKKEKENP